MKRRVSPHPDRAAEPHHDDVGRRVLIVDDEPEFRSVAREILGLAGFEVVGEAVDGRSAVAISGEIQPAVVLLDVQLPDMDGFAVADLLAAQANPPAVVLVSSRDRGAYRRRLAVSPALGFIAKAELSGDALSALID
jgi:DNA-binding NarL/FixJ family response regulator